MKVKSLQSALDESTTKYAKFEKVSWNLQYWKGSLRGPYRAENTLNIFASVIILQDFEAFKEHSTNLLVQEKELNKKLRHMMG